MNRCPLISIVTVCLNSAEYIERCINSVLNQTYNNIEYIIIDGGSTDGTVDIIRRHESRISKWISEKDRGLYDAMNKGIAMCGGEFIGLLNSDDTYPVDAIQTVVDAILADDSIDVLHGDMSVITSQGTMIAKGYHGDLLREWSVKHPTCFIRATVYQTYKYDHTIRVSADYDLLLKLSRNGKRFRHIDHVLSQFSRRGISSQPSWHAVLERYHIRRRYSMGVALGKLIKETILHLDELYSAFRSSRSLEHGRMYPVYAVIKSAFRPLFLALKRLINRL